MTPTDAPLRWSAESLRAELAPLLPGLSVEVVAECASTNTALLERARAGHEPHDRRSAGRSAGGSAQVRRSVESAAFGRRAYDTLPCLLVAQHQTAGRGRQGKAWQAAAGLSLTFSLSLPMNPPDWSGLSLAVGVALADALEPNPQAGAPRLGLKWPNDLWLMDPSGAEGEPIGRKLGGILIESISTGARRLAVIGVGLNVLPLAADSDMNGFSNGRACLQELDAAITAPEVLEQVAAPLIHALHEFNAGGFAGFSRRFEARDLLRGRRITTTQADLREGVAQGVSPGGALRVLAADGSLREVSSGEVSVKLRVGATQEIGTRC